MRRRCLPREAQMKAAILEHYDKHGTPLVLQEVPDPKMGDEDLYIRILTAGVNPLDNMIIRREVELIVPYKPPVIMGNEAVGIVEKCGAAVRGFSAGDRIYARLPLQRIGAFAQYAAVNCKAAAKVPAYLTDEQAACIPLTALTAMQAYDLMQAKSGDSIFISGGSGSLGAMAVPIAKALGMTVYTSGNGSSRERVLKLGADVYIDYRKEKAAAVIAGADNVLDTLGDRALPEEFGLMRPGGTLVSLRGMPNLAFAERMHMPFYKKMLFALAGAKYDRMAKKKNQKYCFMFVKADGGELAQISEIFAERQIQPSVDGVFSLEEVNRALEKVARGGSQGKTVLQISSL